MIIFETLAPILLIIALGTLLARWRFLGLEFQADLNKLAFYVALPALIFENVATAPLPGSRTWILLATLFLSTGTVFFGASLVSRLLGIARSARGSFVQASFRGNLAYIGVPVLAYASVGMPSAEATDHLATALLVMAPTTALFNILAVVALRPVHDSLSRTGTLRLFGSTLAKNPLVIACVAGIAFATLRIPLPRVAELSLEALGAAAVPVSLLCIGGALAAMSLHGNRLSIIFAAVIKTCLSPVIALGIAFVFGLRGDDLRIVLVLASAPTAAAAFIMARQMQGDTTLTSGAIALSTILSAVPLSLALWFTMR